MIYIVPISTGACSISRAFTSTYEYFFIMQVLYDLVIQIQGGGTPMQDVIGGVGTLICPSDSHVVPSTHDPGMNYIQLRSDHLRWFYSLDYKVGPYQL